MKHHSFLLAVLCTLGLSVRAAVGDTFTINYPSGSSSYDVKYEVTGTSTVKTADQGNYFINMAEGMTIVIPEKVTHNGVQYTVTEVGTESFLSWKGVSLTLPNTVTTIESKAFSTCHIPTVSIGTGVTSIGDRAFYRADITQIALPDGLTTIGEEPL